MEYKEFLELTGMMDVTEKQYHDYPEMVYQMDPNMDKRTFCADWAKHSDSIIIDALYNQLNITKGNLDIANETNEKAAKLLIKMAKDCKREDCKQMAIEMVGYHQYISYVLSMGLELNQEERTKMISYITIAKRWAEGKL